MPLAYHCIYCNHRWFPKGKRKPPACPHPRCRKVDGVRLYYNQTTNNNRDTETAKQSPVAVAVALCIGFVFICILIFKPAKPPIETEETKLTPVAEPREKEKDSPPVVVAKKPRPEPLPKEGTIVSPPRLELAPFPERIYNQRPNNYVSNWQRLGTVETRIASIKLDRAKLVDKHGRESVTDYKVLLIWVETRCVVGSIELTHWQKKPSTNANLVGATGVCATVDYGDYTLGNQLTGKIKLSPEVGPKTDLLAFTTPGLAAQTLTLFLNGSHVGQTGKFEHIIEADIWRK